MSAAPAVDATRCPLCGADNRCAVETERATGRPQPACWCMRSPMDASAAQKLAQRLPEGARGLACVCAACMVQLLHEETREHSS